MFSEARLRLPGWRGSLGGFDLTVAGTDGSLVLIETKWDNVWQAMWDIFKLASADQHSRITAGYAIYAASPNEWTKFGGDEFFGADSHSFATDFFLEEHATWWSRNLEGSPNLYPVELPGAVSLQAVARNSVILLGKPYEIRAVQVKTSPAKAVTLTRGIYRS